MSAGAVLAENRYGKSRVRLMKIAHGEQRNELFDWEVEVLVEGDYNAVYTEGDNSGLMATDTMKNAVYSLARRSAAREIERFAKELGRSLLDRSVAVQTIEVTVRSALWKRLHVAGDEDSACFMHGSAERQRATVRQSRGGVAEVQAGFEDMVLLKTSRSAFAGFERDELTTLPETADRLLGTAVQASWSYRSEPVSYDASRAALRDAMLTAFALHESKSVQQTLFAMGQAALGAVAEIDAVDLVMPNRHCLLVDLSRFGQDNPNEIFVPTEEPHGTIEARVRRQR